MKNFVSKLWAILSVFLLLGSFIMGEQLQNVLMKAPFMRIDPYFSGGEVEQTLDMGAFTVNIHEKTFPALIGEADEGFRQITIIKNDTAITRYDIARFAADSTTWVEVTDNTPRVTSDGKTTVINEVGLAGGKLIFRIPLTKNTAFNP